jgi:RimJ/RimL family protein N-acetyltransferase
MAVIEADESILVEATDKHFAWMLGESPAPASGLCLPPDGVEAPRILRLLRGMAERVRAAGSRGSWLIVANGDVVGLCGYKQPPDAGGNVEIGYGIARLRRNRGYATKAVGAMLAFARRDPCVATVVAATSEGNAASQGVLERNGFEKTGKSEDPQDGPLIWWRHELRQF